MGPVGVIPSTPLGDHGTSLFERLEAVQPDALFFERADEPPDQAVLFGRVRRDVLLADAVDRGALL